MALMKRLPHSATPFVNRFVALSSAATVGPPCHVRRFSFVTIKRVKIVTVIQNELLAERLAMGRNVKSQFSSVAATFEKTFNLVLAENPFRNAEPGVRARRCQKKEFHSYRSATSGLTFVAAGRDVTSDCENKQQNKGN